MENSCDVLLMDASVVIPRVGIVPHTSILIEDGKIKGFRKSIGNISTKKKINAEGKYVLPGVIDPHVHYGVFSAIDQAAVTESRSASIGGVTTMIRMLRMKESYRNVEKHLEASRKNHFVDYTIHASILYPEHLKDMKYLRK